MAGEHRKVVESLSLYVRSLNGLRSAWRNVHACAAVQRHTQEIPCDHDCNEHAMLEIMRQAGISLFTLTLPSEWYRKHECACVRARACVLLSSLYLQKHSSFSLQPLRGCLSASFTLRQQTENQQSSHTPDVNAMAAALIENNACSTGKCMGQGGRYAGM